jgi:hypothetical protein
MKEFTFYEKGNVRIFFAEYDRWFGKFIDRKNNIVYYCPLPCIVIRIDKGTKNLPNESKTVNRNEQKEKVYCSCCDRIMKPDEDVYCSNCM